jgi:hypothetical protein
LVIGALQATRVRDPPGGVPVIVGGTARVPALLARGAAERVGELSFRQSRQCSLAPGTRLPTALGWTAMATHLAGRGGLGIAGATGLMFGQGMRFHHDWIRNLADDA